MCRRQQNMPSFSPIDNETGTTAAETVVYFE
jgi:hypothetical protein